MSEGETRSPGRRELWLAALAVALAAVVILRVFAAPFDPTRLHLSGNFVDQAGHILTARTLADTGELKSGLGYPAYMDQESWRLYMPGHYLVQALVYGMFGFGVFQSLLPNLFGFVLCVTGVFLIGQRLAGYPGGAVAAALFALFPGNLTYAFTAMTELTFAAACTWAWVVLSWLPPARRPWLMPVLLAVPFLFRETGALYVIPLGLGLVHASAGIEKRWLKAAAALVASVALLAAVNAWQIADGKGSLPLTWVTGEGFNYGDAFAPPSPELSTSEWVDALGANFSRNWSQTAHEWELAPDRLPITEGRLLILATVICLVGGIVRWRRTPAVLGAGLLATLVLGMIFFLYDSKGQKLLRSMLFTTPALAVGLGVLIAPLVARISRPALQAGAVALLVVLGGWASHGICRRAGAELVLRDQTLDRATQALEGLGHDDTRILLSHFTISLPYAVKHYPVRWSFLPSNDRTLQKLVALHGGLPTLILPRDFLGKTLTAEGLAQAGLEHRATWNFPDRQYLVYGSR